MSVNNEVAMVLYEIGEILTVKGDTFRSRAYQMAAQRITALTEDIRAIKSRGELEAIPGVGKSISAVISEVLDTGQSKVLEELRESLPKGVRDLMELEGVGPKLAMRLNQELGVASIDDLERAAKESRIRELKGFGPKKEANILVSIEAYRSRQTRFLLGSILPVIKQLTEYMRGSDAVLKVEVAGSARRRKETVGDLDVLASSLRPEEVTQRFVTMPPVIRVVSQGPTRSTVVLEGQIQVDLRVVAPEEYGSALLYFTGSKEHNIKLRTIGVKKGFKLNEYGLFDRDTDRRVAGEDEEGIYRIMGMDYMPPELRENTGEIEAAMEHRLPRLVELKQIRGDLHVHTKWSDGTATIEEMAGKAKSMGLEYIAVTDHTKSLGIAHGLDEARLMEQMKEIEQINRKLDDFTVLTGTEVDVKADGSLDLPDSILRDLDFVIASIHSGFKSDVEKMTNRLITAMANEYVDAVGHPTGRIIQKRSPYELNLNRVFEAAAKQRVMMEINAFPDRLDLSDVNSRAAMKAGCVMEIGTDAHASNQLDFLPLGVSVARRGWLEAKDVANTMPAEGIVSLRR
jgi:DNA polymerase (family 10)